MEHDAISQFAAQQRSRLPAGRHGDATGTFAQHYSSRGSVNMEAQEELRDLSMQLSSTQRNYETMSRLVQARQQELEAVSRRDDTVCGVRAHRRPSEALRGSHATEPSAAHAAAWWTPTGDCPFYFER